MLGKLRIAMVFAVVSAAAHAQAFRDPMRPPGVAPSAASVARSSTLQLQGVISGARRSAIVNGRLVKVGDQIAGATIVEVLNDGVRFSRAGKVQTLLLPGVAPIATLRVARSPEATKP